MQFLNFYLTKKQLSQKCRQYSTALLCHISILDCRKYGEIAKEFLSKKQINSSIILMIESKNKKLLSCITKNIPIFKSEHLISENLQYLL